jgi:hypothetical protein
LIISLMAFLSRQLLFPRLFVWIKFSLIANVPSLNTSVSRVLFYTSLKLYLSSVYPSVVFLCWKPSFTSFI